MPSWPVRRPEYGCSTIARSTASRSMAGGSSGARSSTATSSRSAATRCSSWTLCPHPQSRRRASAASLAILRPDGRRHDRGPVAQGRHGQDHDRPHLGRRARRVGLDVLADRPRPAGQPVGLLRRPAGRRADRRRRAGGRREGQGGAYDGGIVPATLNLAEVERSLCGRWAAARAQEGAQGRPQAARRGPDRLPAGARPADRQRARRGRLGDRLLRGAVLRAAGRQRRARGDRAGARVLQRRPARSSAC